MKRTCGVLALAAVFATGAADAQSTFRGDAAHAGAYPGEGPRQFHRVNNNQSDLCFVRHLAMFKAGVVPDVYGACVLDAESQMPSTRDINMRRE